MKKQMPFEIRITLFYLILGILWILFSDKMVDFLTNDPKLILTLSTYKGWFYVLVTGFLLYLLIKREITQRKLIYQELLEVQKKLIVTENLKTAFLSNLSHYIRTPLNSILGFIDLIHDKDTSPEKHELFLTYINEKSNHLLNTLKSIVEISKIQEGLADVKSTYFNINELLNCIEVTAKLDIEKSKKNLTFRTTMVGSQLSDVIFSDRDKVYQILSNIVLNAVHFTEKGFIEVAYFGDKPEHLFRVKDSGVGIAAEKQPLLFSEFMYNSSAANPSTENAGMGLYLSARLAHLLGGRIWLEESSNKGSSFCFTLPFNEPKNKLNN